ncbi:hypothetical protein SDC9_177820 [bioreactor metagenome]|uniref:Uncharacterized protein n=1 Tax=bioreactor metagenome TaxID=1076179 RepID=A0A645GX52_9ZZZZ
MAGIVGQPFGGRAIGFGCKADRPPHLDDHVRDAGTHAGNQLVELGKPLAAATVEFTHMQVQHLGAGVVAVHGFLNLLLHRDGNFAREVLRQPRRCIRSCSDDERLLIFGNQVTVEEIHDGVSVVI